MTYLHAFLLGGLFCLLTQLLFRLTKWPIPVILTVAFCLGVVMTALGWMDVFTGFGQSGMFLLLYGGGDAAYRGMVSLLAGDPGPILRYLALILFCFAVGIGGGVLLHREGQRK